MTDSHVGDGQERQNKWMLEEKFNSKNQEEEKDIKLEIVRG